MSLPSIDTARGWQDLTLIATDGVAIGKIESIYVDRETRQPEWVLVRAGPTGTFVPILDAAQEGDTVRVPHQQDTIRTAPGVGPDGDLSEDEEARLYRHYGVAYSTAASASGLPAGEADAVGHGQGAEAVDAPGRLTRHQDAASGDAGTVTPAAAEGGTGAPAGTSTMPVVVTTAAGRRDVEDADTVGADTTRPQLTTVPAGADAGAPPAGQQRAGHARLVAALTGAGAAAAAGSVALARRRQARRRPQGFAQLLVALGLTRPPRRRGLATVFTRPPRRRGVAAALSSAGQALGEGATTARQAGQALGQAATAATGPLQRRRRPRSRASARQEVASRLDGAREAWARAIHEAARATEQAAEATRQAAHTAASATESVRAAPLAATRKVKVRRAHTRGAAAPPRPRVRPVPPRRQRRSRTMGKVTGRLGLTLGAAAGYVLGARAGRERYEQMAGAFRALTEKPQVKRFVEQAPSTVTSTVEQVADKAANKVRQAGDKVAGGGRDGKP